MRSRSAFLRPPVLVAVLLVPGMALSDAPVQWFGGTRWDAVESRWEALPDSVWTFDSGVASAINADPSVKPVGFHRIMEGWVGLDLTGPSEEALFRRMTAGDFSGEDAVCVGAAAGLGGSASAWAGLLTPEAASASYAGGRGYGNRWNAILARSFAYSGGDATLAFNYACDTEAGFDYAYAEIDTSGDGSAAPVEIVRYTGAVSGSASLPLSHGAGTLPSAPGPVTLRFRVASDVAYSDQDASYDTNCGAFAVDDIGLSGGLSGFSDFEGGDDGWSQVPPPPGEGGDWTTLMDVSDLGVPGGCALEDSVLTVWNRDFGMVAPSQSNLAVSPWIDLEEAGVTGLTGHVIEFDVYQDPPHDWVGVHVMIQYHPDPQGWGLFHPHGCFFGPFPCVYFSGCSQPGYPARFDVSEWVPEGTQEIRVALGAWNECETWNDCPESGTDTTPYFDNVRYGVFDPTITGLPGDVTGEGVTLGAFRPNPLVAGRAGLIMFGIGAAADVRLEVLDIAGRDVTTLIQGRFPPGEHVARWDGRDGANRPVAAGVYFLRLRAGGETRGTKVVIR